MSDNGDLWEVRERVDGLALELWGGEVPALVLTRGENRVSVELAHVKGLAAALVAGATDLAEMLAAGGEYHA